MQASAETVGRHTDLHHPYARASAPALLVPPTRHLPVPFLHGRGDA